MCVCVLIYIYYRRFARGITVVCIGILYIIYIYLLKCENDTMIGVFGDGTREGVVRRLSFVWYYL